MMNYQEMLFRQKQGFECNPAVAAWAAFAVQAASATAQIVQAHQESAAQADYAEQQSKAVNKGAQAQQSQLRIQEAQNAESKAREDEKQRLAANKTLATASVQAGEAGITGNTVDALLAEHKAALGTYREAASRQITFDNSGIDAQIQGITDSAKANQLQLSQKIWGTNWARFGSEIGKAGFAAYSQYNPNAFRKKT